MTTRAELMETLENIEVGIARNIEILPPFTLIKRLRLFLSQRSIAAWKAEVASRPDRVKASGKEIKHLRTRKANINKALEVWLDAGDVIGKYAPKRETNEWQGQ